MRKYTLNDINFNPEPITFFEPDPNYKPDQKAIEESAQKNRELFEEFQKVCKRKIMRRIMR